MTQRLTALAAFGLLLCVASSARADDQEKIQGTWKAEKATLGGMDAPAQELEKMVLEFKGNKATPRDKQDNPADFTLDATKKPKTMDLKTAKGETMQGIYELDGDTLKVCLSREGERPTKFESAEGSRTMVIVFKREKK